MSRDRDEAVLAMNIRSIEDLTAALGGLSEAELRRLADPALYAPPSDEELSRMGPRFTERVQELTNLGIPLREGQRGRQWDVLTYGLEVLRALSDVENEEMRPKQLEVAGRLADIWLAQSKDLGLSIREDQRPKAETKAGEPTGAR